MKKKALSLLALAILLSTISVLAINLEVQSKAISNDYVIELDEPAVFDLTIKNLGEPDTFEIYSLVGINITHAPFSLEKDETKTIRIYLRPQEALKKQQSYIFEYKIKDTKNKIQSESLTLNIMNLNSVFTINADPINPKSEKIGVNIKNNIKRDFKNINFKLKSRFFENEQTITFGPDEKKFIEIPLDLEKLRNADAGNYEINTQIEINDLLTNLESQLKFLEAENIETTEEHEGTIIKRTEITKKNSGNVKNLVKINTEKNIIAYFFTTTNIPATNVETEGFLKRYTWEKVLSPGGELNVIIKTNWLFPIIILILIVAGITWIRRFIYDTLELTKKVSYIKTKGGQFALKVTVKVKAKKKLEKITIVDKLPPLVKLYDKFGILPPEKIDLETKKLTWSFPTLYRDETRILTYIIYSDKIGVVGKFELPEAKALYEDEGKLKETESNKSFYVRDGEL